MKTTLRIHKGSQDFTGPNGPNALRAPYDINFTITDEYGDRRHGHFGTVHPEFVKTLINAVNSHEALVEALHKMYNLSNRGHLPNAKDLIQAQEALTAAGGA